MWNAVFHWLSPYSEGFPINAPINWVVIGIVDQWIVAHGPLTRYIKIRVALAPGIPGTFSPPPRISDPEMHHGTCVTHVPWCMPGSLTSGFIWRRSGKNVPDIPGACTICNFTHLVRGPVYPKPMLNKSSCGTMRAHQKCQMNAFVNAFWANFHEHFTYIFRC